jgi:hypothetical protein
MHEKHLDHENKKENSYGIDATKFIERFDVNDEKTRETLYEFPTLCYLLGKVTDKPQGKDSRPDGVERQILYLTNGSGLFGLKNLEDAQRWKGIFNHIVGSARQVYFLSQKLLSLDDKQEEELIYSGFDMNSLRGIDPKFLRDFMFVSHAGRRQIDERDWHNLKDESHPKGDSESLTFKLLKIENTPIKFTNFLKVENHEFLKVLGKRGHFVDIPTNILTYCDWTFGQEPVTLEDRFKSLRSSKRQPPEILDILEKCGNYFEKGLKKTLGPDFFAQMSQAYYPWETEIRKAYCSPSGSDMKTLFPNYKPQIS